MTDSTADTTDAAAPEPRAQVRRSALLEAVHGAVEASGLDAGTAAHYGDPVREQRALARGAAVVDLSHKGVLTVTGPDRLSWLTTLSSQVLTGLRPGESAETLFLSVQGRVEHAPHVIEDGRTAWLVTEPHETEPLRKWLESMRFALRVEIADRSDDIAVVGAVEVPEHLLPPAQEPSDGRCALVWEDPWPGVAEGGWAYGEQESHPGRDRRWHEVLIPRDRLVEAVTGPAADGLELAGSWAGEALRIEAWRPRLGADTDERTVPHELDWLRTAVHLAKGCYKGQETVARVHNLGHPPRRLVFLDLDGSEHTLPRAGAEVLSGERVVGRVSSAALHHEAGPIALAVIKRSVDPQAPLRVRERADDAAEAAGSAADREQDSTAPREEWAAAQTVVVPPDAGQVVQREKGFLRRPGGRS
ncbi:folate-binding protein YgfZ [Kocuria palustris]|uniref:CAF17-like 4Fe-4S cluster assembly/insertion protein YgfZ n=1 Tax=Kocuria palustris TaxID=71999 RepID=UPI0011A5C29D|nr:folate-binding protein YgfZ [Kocuria palustris]